MYAKPRESQNVAVDANAVEQAADELYALPPADFTRERDERAKALRKEKRRDEADAVKALRKPTVAAWALNQLARRRAKDVERLVAAGEELRAAQEELLAGGDRKAFQSAAAQEREQVAKVADEAAALVGEVGERAGPALREKISATLHAAALDEETAEELRAGRLVREREAIGGFGGMTAAVPAKKSSTEGRQKSGRTTPSKAAKESARAKRGKASGRGKGANVSGADGERREAARRRAEAEKREAAEQRQRLAAARTDERHARRDLDAADKAIAHAETRAEAARVHAEEAKARAKVTGDRLKEARREHAAAKKAHARAGRALAEAERGA
jgi:hypothetical protein